MKTEQPINEIVLIDDEPSVVFALKLVLQAIGFAVRDFVLPKEALQFLESGAKADLVLCDLRMPELDGHNFLRKLKVSRPEIPFVMISGHATDTDVATALGLGAAGFLMKPFSPQQLFELIDNLPPQTARVVGI